MSKQSRKQGQKKSEKTIEWCRLIVEELKTGDKTSIELEKKFGINKGVFPSVLLQLTYEAPVYDYKKGNQIYLGLVK